MRKISYPEKYLDQVLLFLRPLLLFVGCSLIFYLAISIVGTSSLLIWVLYIIAIGGCITFFNTTIHQWEYDNDILFITTKTLFKKSRKVIYLSNIEEIKVNYRAPERLTLYSFSNSYFVDIIKKDGEVISSRVGEDISNARKLQLFFNVLLEENSMETKE